MPYEFLEEVAIADIAFRAWGGTLDEVFMAAADATMRVMIDNLESIQSSEHRPIRLENRALDLLLFDLLQELIYFKDAEQLLLRVRHARVTPADGRWTLTAEGYGERLNPAWHQQRIDVKAVTLHNFKLEKTASGWSATVILDV